MIKIDAPRYLVEQMIDATIASMKRAVNTSKRPEFIEFYRRDQAILANARATLEELPPVPKTTK